MTQLGFRGNRYRRRQLSLTRLSNVESAAVAVEMLLSCGIGWQIRQMISPRPAEIREQARGLNQREMRA